MKPSEILNRYEKAVQSAAIEHHRRHEAQTKAIEARRNLVQAEARLREWKERAQRAENNLAEAREREASNTISLVQMQPDGTVSGTLPCGHPVTELVRDLKREDGEGVLVCASCYTAFTTKAIPLTTKEAQR